MTSSSDAHQDAIVDWKEQRRYVNECFRATALAIEGVPLDQRKD
jgi:hypothetical protein